ncbi:uncharacterized protein LOC114356802 [Ostrinia furnacalis]|uniref:uncharacterized protein LOC114356802 n=1 Tax=Ostrinia furnacalis TaxID=93504 RepID=UPI00104065F5|nr:uncharacterized protein LOC114356802 [Ostrinia furnacalis]
MDLQRRTRQFKTGIVVSWMELSPGATLAVRHCGSGQRVPPPAHWAVIAERIVLDVLRFGSLAVPAPSELLGAVGAQVWPSTVAADIRGLRAESLAVAVTQTLGALHQR